MNFRSSALLLIFLLVASARHDGALRAADESKEKAPERLEVHEMSVWMFEPGGSLFNPQQDHQNSLPPVVDSSRPRRLEQGEGRGSPVSIITFSGSTKEPTDLTLRIHKGRILAHWPPAETKNNRLRWLDLNPKAESETSPAFVSDDHWFHKARQLGTLALHQGSRTERFLVYDGEFNGSLPIKLEGGPDQYRVLNSGKTAIRDLLVITPTPQGRRVGWVSEVAAATPAPAKEKGEAKEKAASDAQEEPKAEDAAETKVVAGQGRGMIAALVKAVAEPLSPKTTPVAPSDSAQSSKASKPNVVEGVAEVEMSPPLDDAQFEVQAKQALADRLTSAGLHEKEIELLLSIYAGPMLSPEEMIVVCRVPDATLDEISTLSIEPESAKIVRVALAVCRNVDPQIRDKIKQLIVQLGDESFAQREAAEAELRKLGRAAAPLLKEAVGDDDPERVMRVERLLYQQAKSASNANPASVNGFALDQF